MYERWARRLPPPSLDFSAAQRGEAWLPYRTVERSERKTHHTEHVTQGRCTIRISCLYISEHLGGTSRVCSSMYTAEKSGPHPSNQENAEQTETSAILFRSIREVRLQGKLLPPKLERDRQVDIENHNLAKQKHP